MVLAKTLVSMKWKCFFFTFIHVRSIHFAVGLVTLPEQDVTTGQTFTVDTHGPQSTTPNVFRIEFIIYNKIELTNHSHAPLKMNPVQLPSSATIRTKLNLYTELIRKIRKWLNFQRWDITQSRDRLIVVTLVEHIHAHQRKNTIEFGDSTICSVTLHLSAASIHYVVCSVQHIPIVVYNECYSLKEPLAGFRLSVLLVSMMNSTRSSLDSGRMSFVRGIAHLATPWQIHCFCHGYGADV